jgi:hypothetical protein
MANRNAPNGLSPVKQITGSPFNDQINAYILPATDTTALFIGDVVKLASGSTYDTVSGRYLNNVTALTTPATDIPVGVVVGFYQNPDNLMQKYRPASTQRVVWVADSPETIFSVQSDVTGVTAAQLTNNASLTVTAGNTVTGNSNEVLTAPATTSTLPLMIMGIDTIQNNTTGAYARVLVMFNKHQYLGNQAGV